MPGNQCRIETTPQHADGSPVINAVPHAPAGGLWTSRILFLTGFCGAIFAPVASFRLATTPEPT
jgi:hypothetical protein